MTALIGVDWGSSNVRAFRFADDGGVAEQRQAPRGSATLTPNGFEPVLAELIAGWERGPMVIAGMAGSRGGWVEAPYLPCPADPAAIADAAVPVATSLGRCVILPGLSCRSAEGVADVMRGEETQLLGLGVADGLVVMPGTHCKWAQLLGGKVESFRTSMTGELYALLLRHALVGRLAEPEAPHNETAFRLGAERALEQGGALPLLFSARAEALLGALAPAAVASYLAGVLIGGEVAHGLVSDTAVTIVGSSALCARYATALSLAGATDVASVDGDTAVAKGLWIIGRTLT